MPRHGFQACNVWDEKKHPGNAIAEIKYDGMMVLAEDGRLWNRPREGKNARDVTAYFPEVRVHDSLAVVGELVILKDGISQFHLLLRRLVENPKDVRLRSVLYPATLVAFDLLEMNGQDLQGDPLSVRRKALEGLEHSKALNGSVHVADFWGCPPDKVTEYLELIQGMGGEGVIVKDLDAPYAPKRSDAWLKVKAWETVDLDVQGHVITDKGAVNVLVVHQGRQQEVVVGNQELAAKVVAGKVKRITIRYLRVEDSGALYEAHVHGVPWD